jgi:hypothetical protein
VKYARVENHFLFFCVDGGTFFTVTIIAYCHDDGARSDIPGLGIRDMAWHGMGICMDACGQAKDSLLLLHVCCRAGHELQLILSC